MAMAFAFTLMSSAFSPNAKTPKRYTGEGQDVSPPLTWSNPPPGTVEFAVICEDPDAPQTQPFVHWLIYNIDGSLTQLPEGIEQKPSVPGPVLAEQGVNSFSKIGYNGPMPPNGHGEHRYIFTLYALKQKLGLKGGITKRDLLHAMEGKVLAATTLVGTYERAKLSKSA